VRDADDAMAEEDTASRYNAMVTQEKKKKKTKKKKTDIVIVVVIVTDIVVVLMLMMRWLRKTRHPGISPYCVNQCRWAA
jgi:flagellar basal body-associated protein FliL